MKNLTYARTIIMLFFVIGCTPESGEEEKLFSKDELSNLINNYKELKIVDNYEMSKEEFECFHKKGLDGDYVRVFNSIDIRTGEASKVYEIGRDVYINEKDLFEVEELNNISAKEGVELDLSINSQYRTTSLVSVNGKRIIEVKAINFFYFQNMNNVAQGLTRAVENYNNQNLTIELDLNFYTITTLAESWPLYTPGINVVIHNGTGSSLPGGSATFPNSGNPGKEVRINAGTNNYSLDINEHVATHEIGHCLGMRHTDFFNRSISCGSGGNEGDAGVGAIHIPGTPAQVNIDMNSVFLSCFSEFTNGEFSNADIVALQNLY